MTIRMITLLFFLSFINAQIVLPTFQGVHKTHITVAESDSQTFSYTGSVQTLTVSSGVDMVTIQAYGAQGQATTNEKWVPSTGGLGGYATGELSVSSGQVLYVYVGGAGTDGAAGYNGGGLGGNSSAGSNGMGGRAGSGGGASDIRVDGTNLSNRVIVAGGGGGGGRDYVNGSCQPCGVGGNGGAGGGTTGSDGDDPSVGNYNYSNAGAGGSGGTQSAGGAGGDGTQGTTGNSGTSGIGGAGIDGNYDVASGGGGGGYWGGGAGGGARRGSGAAGGGGGGGSSYIGDDISSGSTTSGQRSGNGQIIITW